MMDAKEEKECFMRTLGSIALPVVADDQEGIACVLLNMALRETVMLLEGKYTPEHYASVLRHSAETFLTKSPAYTEAREKAKAERWKAKR